MYHSFVLIEFKDNKKVFSRSRGFRYLDSRTQCNYWVSNFKFLQEILNTNQCKLFFWVTKKTPIKIKIAETNFIGVRWSLFKPTAIIVANKGCK
jgi:hypothetical protein